MERIKGILAAGALTSLVLATAVGLNVQNILDKQPPTPDENPVVVIQRVTPTAQPAQPVQSQPSFQFQSQPVVGNVGGEREGDDEHEDGDGERDGGGGDSERDGGGGDGERDGGDD